MNGDPGSTCFKPQLPDGHPHSFWALIACLCFSWHLFCLQSKSNNAVMVARLHCQWKFSLKFCLNCCWRLPTLTTNTTTAPHGNGWFLLFCYRNKRRRNFSHGCHSVNDTKAPHHHAQHGEQCWHATGAAANAKHCTGLLFCFVLLMDLVAII